MRAHVQEHIARKFQGNLRLEEEFRFIQQPETRQLQNWQRWKSGAVREGRWTDWQGAERQDEAVREHEEIYRDPFQARRIARRQRRALNVHKEQARDIQAKIENEERKDLKAWSKEYSRISKLNSPGKVIQRVVALQCAAGASARQNVIC